MKDFARVLILAVDTSLPILTVALVRDGALLGTIGLQGKGSRNEKVLPAIDWLLAEARVTAAEVDLFAVTRGPGSFTGVRIGLATVQGLALAVGKPVCAMNTHEAAAWSDGEPSGKTLVADDAGRGEFYVTLFDDRTLVEGPKLVGAGERERMRGGAVEHYLPLFSESRSVALGCARLAAAIATAGDLPLWSDITPVYVRLAEAEVKLQQAAPGDERA